MVFRQYECARDSWNLCDHSNIGTVSALVPHRSGRSEALPASSCFCSCVHQTLTGQIDLQGTLVLLSFNDKCLVCKSVFINICRQYFSEVLILLLMRKIQNSSLGHYRGGWTTVERSKISNVQKFSKNSYAWRRMGAKTVQMLRRNFILIAITCREGKKKKKKLFSSMNWQCAKL